MGLVIETGATSTGVGRTPIAVSINSERYFFYAIDIRHNESVVALYDLSARRLALDTVRHESRKRSARKVLSSALDRLDEIAHAEGVQRRSVKGVGLSIPGVLDRKSGTVMSSAVLQWKNVPVHEIVDEHFSHNVFKTIDKTANDALRAELVKGNSLPDNVTGVYVQIAGEVDSAMILDGKILSGYPYGSGSFGRSPIMLANGVSQSVSWQDLISVEALMAKCGANASEDRNIQKQFLAQLRTQFLRGTRTAKDAVAHEARMLAVGFANIFMSLGLPSIIVGGEIREIWDILQSDVYAECKRLTAGDFPRAQKIRIMTLSENESLDGAALDAIGSVVPLELISQLAVQQKAVIEQIAIGADSQQ